MTQVTQDYYGTKRVTAWPANRLDPLRRDENAPGYAVQYDGGYRSWSPKVTFEAAYQPLTALSFGHAIVALKAGHKVARAGWNGKGMWLWLEGEKELTGGTRPDIETWKGKYLPWIGMRTAQGDFVPWLASQTDMLADDWQIVA